MKIWKLIFKLIVIVLLIAIVALIVFVKTFDIQKYRTQINAKISNQIGRDLQSKKISLNFSFQKGLTVVLKGVTLADSPEFSNKYFLQVDSISLTADVMRFFKEREIYVSHISLQSPQIKVIRNLSGNWNTAYFSKRNISPVPSQNLKQEVKVSVSDGVARPSVEQSPFLIKKIHVLGGTILYLDQKSKQLTRIPINSLRLKVLDFEFDQFFQFQSKFSLWSDIENIKFSGEMKIGQSNGSVHLKNVVFATDFAKLNWEDVQKDAPVFELAKVKKIEQGRFSLKVKESAIEFGKIKNIMASGNLVNGKVKTDVLNVPIENIDLEFQVSEKNIDVSKIFLYVGTGKVMGSIELRDYLQAQIFNYELSFENFLLQEVFSDFDLPFQLEGVLFGSFNGKGNGFVLEDLKQKLSSDIELRIEKGRLKDVNVTRLVLSKISMIPYLLENVEKNLPQRFKDNLNNNDTAIDQAGVILKIDQGKVLIKEMKAGAEGFKFESSGWVDFNQNMWLETTFKIPEDLSSNIVSSASELNVLLDEQQQINIPLLPYEGKLKDVRLKVDTDFLVSHVVKQKGKQELKKLIFKALDIDEDFILRSPQQGQGESVEDTQSNLSDKKEPVEKRPEAIIIENILDTIFK